MSSAKTIFLAMGLLALTTVAHANPALEGYANDALYAQRIQKLAESKLVRVTSLAKTTGGRELQLISISRADDKQKPAVLIVGNVYATHLLGSEMALRMAEYIVAHEQEEAIAKLLNETTLYVLPRPDPDATAKAFLSPFREIGGNARPTDDDRDGQVGEDPPEDLNGDGWITTMRVADAAGRWMPHPTEPRVLIEADRTKHEQGQFSLYIEGRDDDGDEQFNEDGSDGVAFHRNFPHRFQPFQSAAGPNAVSEAESRAIVDFCFDHPNIFAVFCFSPEDNLFHPWKADGKVIGKVPQTILAGDAAYQDFLATQYRELHGGKDAPETAAKNGSFAEWSYFQFGRWTFSSRAWWSGKIAAPKPEKEEPGEKKKEEEKRGKEDIEYLRWLTAENIPGFVEWQAIEHPQFPGKKVEVGGFKPFYRTNPPAKEIDALVGKHLTFLEKLADSRPKVALTETKTEALAGNIFRITATLSNRGYLPTLPEIGETTGVHQRLQIQLHLPEKSTFIQGSPRVKLSRLESNSTKEIVWLVQLPNDQPTTGTLKIWSPEIDPMEKNIELTPIK